MTSADKASNYSPIRRVGSDAGHHFFGYYNKTTWDRDGRNILALRVPMATADLTGKEAAEVGYFDLDDGDRFEVVDRVTTWNWQMGNQLQWLDGEPGRKIIYNIRAENPHRENVPFPEFQSRIRDLDTGETRDLPLPVYVVAPNSEYALCINYSRLMITHKTIGYAAADKEPPVANAPVDDGIFRMDLRTGEFKLLMSFDDLKNLDHRVSMDKAIHWCSHLEISTDSKRFLLLHRWTERVEDETCFLHRLITADADGGNIRLLECSDHPLPQLEDSFDPNAVGTFDYEKSEYQISHPLWVDEDRIVVWGPHDGEIHYQLYNDKTGAVETIGPGVLTENGHMTFSKDGRWLLSDTYPDDQTNERLLFLYELATGERHDLGSFYTSPDLGKHNRCDLHPRWSRDGREVCIDSIHDGERQMYVVDISDIVDDEVGASTRRAAE
ncbi:MAG: hypothetical protein MnENMB40S_04570 [Rhizobiaceae bacterium MnEN-MB40S]|nr:MAG: hypothetical protein MnENMB40S_04570 [Rhizobiaceae bacterium MnEN-MB40S]